MARRKSSGRLTPLELQLMHVLWEQGPQTVQEVQQALGSKMRLAYTTVQTMLNLLYRKKKVKRVLQNRAYVYHPLVSYEEAARLESRAQESGRQPSRAETAVVSCAVDIPP